jgi:hypothetical protein
MTPAVPQPHLHLISGRPRVHFTLQGKGGVGKSFVSSLVAQYLRASETAIRCIDTDPVNDTLTQVRGLNAEHLNLMRHGRVDERVFDDLIGTILADPVSFVVDTGATSFVALTRYLKENDAFQLLRDNGRDVIVHTVIAGGQACRDTVIGFRLIATGAAPGSLVVWLNEFFGPVDNDVDTEGKGARKSFTEFKVYEDNRQAVLGIVTLDMRNPDTFGRDIQEMTTQKLTFDEVRQSDRWSLVAKSRIFRVQEDIYSQLQSVLG